MNMLKVLCLILATLKYVMKLTRNVLREYKTLKLGVSNLSAVKAYSTLDGHATEKCPFYFSS